LDNISTCFKRNTDSLTRGCEEGCQWDMASYPVYSLVMDIPAGLRKARLLCQYQTWDYSYKVSRLSRNSKELTKTVEDREQPPAFPINGIFGIQWL